MYCKVLIGAERKNLEGVSKDYIEWHERALARAVELLEGATNIATAHVTHGTVYSELMDARAFLAEVCK